MSLHIQLSLNPSSEDINFLGKGIYEEALKKKNMSPVQPFGFFLKDSNGKIVGGVNGFCYYGCLYMDQLYVEDRYPRQGWGRELVKRAEAFGMEQKCTIFTVTTMDWEAKSFYEKLGYALEFCRSGYENDSTMYYFCKK
ncbi:MAG: GNAT family N-acetyltransferase [Candidatus Paracaedibacter sp.]